MKDFEPGMSVRDVQHLNPHLPGDQDCDFLHGRSAFRGLRILMDYLKPETFMSESGIDETLTLFGSARLLPPPQAAEQQARVEQAWKSGKSTDLALVQAKNQRQLSQYYEVAETLSRIVGQAYVEKRTRLVVMTGGGPGIMEAGNKGAFEAGAKTVGMGIQLPMEQQNNPYVSDGLNFLFHYFDMRKLHLLKRSKALVVFPGGFGTMDELFESLVLIQTHKLEPLPVILVGQSYWQQAVNMEFLVQQGMIHADDLDLFHFADTAEEIMTILQQAGLLSL